MVSLLKAVIHCKFSSDISEWLYKEQKCCGGGHSSTAWRNGTNTRHDSQSALIQPVVEIPNQTHNLDKNYPSFFSLVIFRPSFSWHIDWENFLSFSFSEGLVCQIERIIQCFFYLLLLSLVGFRGGIFIWF